MPPQAYVNRIATAVPAHDINAYFLDLAQRRLAGDPRLQDVFRRMTDKSGIEHRYACVAPDANLADMGIDAETALLSGTPIGTARRMELFAANAPQLAQTAIERLELGADLARITHLIVTSCTGFSAPGIDLDLVQRCGLANSVERTIIGFMGCYAAMNALKQARHIVRSEPEARVLVVNIELCTLHLRDSSDLATLLSFCLWGDGCAASLVTAEPYGIGLDSFYAVVAHERRELMTWAVQNDGFEMFLSGQIPAAIHDTLAAGIDRILDHRSPEDIDLWAIHPGGRSILDAVERTLHLKPDALDPSREVLRRYGNMSSATVMFVLEQMLNEAGRGLSGCAMAFGPGLTSETMLFHTAAAS